MKIAILSAYQNVLLRGAEMVVKELTTHIQGHGIQVFSGRIPPPPRWPILWRFFIDPQGIYIFFFTLKLLVKLLRERFNIVIPVNGGWQPALTRLATWLYGGKMIIVGHSGIGWDDRNNLWSLPDAFVALSSYAKHWAKHTNPWVRVRYIPNGVDTEHFNPNGEKLKLNLKRPVILCVGALTPEKRIDLAIKAVAQFGKASLLIVGDGPLKDEIENLCQRLFGDRFSARGGSAYGWQLIKMPYERMPQLYRTVDVFTLPSVPWQSFELVLLEAMATNLPVVATDDPIREEIVGEAGILVDPTNTKAYAQALEKALNTKWGEKPRHQAEKFSWAKIAPKYEQLFESFIK